MGRVPSSLFPPQTIIWLPVQMAVCPNRASGARFGVTGCHSSVDGLYLPPVLSACSVLVPPQTIIWLPVQMAVCPNRAPGARFGVTGCHSSVDGLYLLPVSK